METEKMKEYGLKDGDLDGEAIGNGLNYIEITASNEDDCTVKIRGAVETDIETMNGDVCIEIGLDELSIFWHGSWQCEVDEPNIQVQSTKEGLKVKWTKETIEKVKWSVQHVVD